MPWSSNAPETFQPPMELTIQYNPPPDEISWIRERLLDHNGGIIQGYGYETVMVKTLSNDGTPAGALAGEIGGDWFYIDGLWVDQSLRHKGIGSRLLDRAEGIARQKQCRGLYLYTYSFQAPDFYKKAGYQVFGTLEHFCGSHAKIFMKKELA